MFRAKKPAVSVSIARAALESIFDECDRYNADETGGRLIGTYRGKGSHFDVKVSGVIGPGPNAQRSSTSFFQDGDYQEQVFRAIESRHPNVEHLGNWHTHHVNGYPTLSGGDITTYRNIVNHRNHNTDFFYALLVVRKNAGRGPRYGVKHFFFRRNEDAVYEIADADIAIVDAPLLSPGDPELAKDRTTDSGEVRQSTANPERAKDKEFFADFFPGLKALFSEKIGAPYWKGALTLVDGSRIGIVAVEGAASDGAEYSIVTSPDNTICPDIVAAYKGRKFPAARHAVLYLERDLNQALYRSRK
jgi:proteasome lid subunit RPN8/RPN11